MSERFYSSQSIIGERVTLVGSEAHHLLHVMRAGIGDSVTLFDGSGTEFDATVETPGRAAVELRIRHRRQVDRELLFPLTFGVALPKGDRQKWLIEKLTELGVSTLVPLITERGVAQPTASALERLGRSVIEAAKQCGRNRLMSIAEPQSWSQWINRGSPGSSISEPPDSRRLFAHPTGQPLSEIDLAVRLPTQLAVGPEGGFSDGEVEEATEAGWQPVNLGPRILRVETAAIALAAAVAVH